MPRLPSLKLPGVVTSDSVVCKGDGYPLGYIWSQVSKALVSKTVSKGTAISERQIVEAVR